MPGTAAFVLNRTRVRAWTQVSGHCRAAAAASGWTPLLLETVTDDADAGLARAAVADGAGVVFAVGGDGTVRACAEALAGTGVPLGIVPLGTANLTARALGIPAGLGAALAVGFGRHERRIDLAVAEGITCAAMAGIGVDAAVVSATPDGLKARAGWLAYAVAGTRQVVAFGASWMQTVRVRKPSEPQSGADTFPVGNGVIKLNADQPRARALLDYKEH